MDRAKIVIFATKNEYTARAFERHVRYQGKENDETCFFDLYRPNPKSEIKNGDLFQITSSNGPGQEKEYKKSRINQSAVFTIKETPNELVRLLEDRFYDRLCQVVVILDYASLRDDFTIFSGTYLSPIARLFLCYPEITLWVLRMEQKKLPLFSDSGFRDSNEGNTPQSLEPVERYHYLVKDLDEVLNFGYKLKWSRSLFDPSGIRNFIKMKLIEKIEFKYDNFEPLHNSRRDRIALAIDEEPRHAMFWAYTLYNFGYSVLPVVTAGELKSLMEHYENFDVPRVDLVCRDFDLQFPDLPATTEEDPRKIPLYQYRGVIPREERSEAFDLNLKKPDGVIKPFYWDAFFEKDKTRGMFISQLPLVSKVDNEQMEVIASEACIRKQGLKDDKNFRDYGITTTHSGKVILKGISKEIDGMYDFLQSPEVKSVYEDSCSCTVVSKRRGNVSGHSIPAINSRIAISLIDRGKKAYKNGYYMEAALLASEALEVLNGLSMSASMEAFHLKCCAEVKFELNVIGVGNFKTMAKKRIFEIRSLLYRLTADNNEARRNAKMQIFNDLRKIYEEHEQFDASEIVYSEVIKAELGIRDIMSYKIQDRIRPADSKRKGGAGPKIYSRNWTQSFRYLYKFLVQTGNTWLLFILGFIMTSNYVVLKGFTEKVEPSVVFPWIYLVLFLGLTLLRRKKLIYLIIGAGSNFIRLFSTFIAFNLTIFLVYWINFHEHFKKVELLLPKTWITSFINEPFQLLEPEFHQSVPVMIYVLVIIHVIVSVFYLGVLISALYRWFVRR